MRAEIVTIGDEILIGQVVDTNSAFIASELNKIGISVYQITSVQDERQHLLNALKEAGSRADIILITGGLGPTRDDITKQTLCEFFDDTLVTNEQVLQHIEALFRHHFSAPISEVNRRQALVPSRADVLPNAYGTAPGMWIAHQGKVFISLPGVPFEMKELFLGSVIPRLSKDFHRPHILHRTIHTYGMGESAIAERIAEWEDNLPSFIRLAYLPNLGKVRLRLSARGSSLESLTTALEDATQSLYALIGDIIQGEEGDSLEVVLGKILTDRGMTLATAESFTGGTIAADLTSIPGSSAYFRGGVVSYATETKSRVLGVPEALIQAHSVVSEEVAIAMANGARELMQADFAIATTGNAGPAKGDSDAEIGTVIIAIATPESTTATKFHMGNHRERIVRKSVHKAFEMLRKEILKF